MKYTIFGGSGQLGSELVATLRSEKHEVHTPSHIDCDLVSINAIARVLNESNPDVVINCAAYNRVDNAELENGGSALAMAINCWGVENIATWCNFNNKRLVHFSTDYVFGLDVEHGFPLTEDEQVGPLSVYGMSKLCGEYRALACNPNTIIYRTCGLYSDNNKTGKLSFAHRLLRQVDYGNTIPIVADQFCTPTYVPDLVAAVVSTHLTLPRGIYHATNGGYCSWYEYAAELIKLTNTSILISPVDAAAQLDSDVVRARRPYWSVLDCQKLRSRNAELRHWKKALAEFAEHVIEEVATV